MTKGELTVKQQRILDYIKSETRRKGYPPAIREICEAFGLSSTATVHSYLTTLERKGYIRREHSKNRSIELLEADARAYQGEYADVPIVGKVRAGAPVLAAEDVEGVFPIPVEFIGNHDAFMMRVSGDSMEDAGIFHGDLILVCKQNFATNGDIVVALLDDSVTVKRYFAEKNFIRLQSESSGYEDIITRKARILGKVIGLYRQI